MKANNNFTKGISLNHQVLASNINFNWGTGILISIPDIRDNVYLEFIGYIKVPAKKVIFKLGSDDGSRLYIASDGNENKIVRVIDNWNQQPYRTVESDVFNVSQDVYIPFKIEYFESHSDSKLTLEWALDDNAVKGTSKYEIISQENFYYDKTMCSDNIKPLNSLSVSK